MDLAGTRLRTAKTVERLSPALQRSCHLRPMRVRSFPILFHGLVAGASCSSSYYSAIRGDLDCFGTPALNCLPSKSREHFIFRLPYLFPALAPSHSRFSFLLGGCCFVRPPPFPDVLIFPRQTIVETLIKKRLSLPSSFCCPLSLPFCRHLSTTSPYV